MSVRACPVCGSGNAASSERCWVCGASVTNAGPTAPHVPAPVRKSGDTLEALGWLALLSGIGFVTVLVAIELALEWPGLLIPYAVVVLVGFAALARTAWLQTRGAPPQRTAPARAHPQQAAPPQTAPAPARERSLAEDVALGLAIALAIIAALGLLAVAAFVIFMVICFAIIASSGL